MRGKETPSSSDVFVRCLSATLAVALLAVAEPARTVDYKVDCTPLTSKETVKVGAFPGLSMATYSAAQGLGLFSKENVIVDTIPMTGLAEAVSLLAKGEIDVAVAAVTGAFLSAQAQRLDVRFVISQGQENLDKPASGFYVRPELLDNGTIKTMSDLRGRKVALFGPTGSSGYYLSLILKTGNLGLSDVQLAPMQYSDMVGAMRNGAIDAAIISAPFNTLVEQDKSGRRFGDRDALARLPITAIAFGPNLLQKRPQAACAYVRASLRAAREALKANYNEDQHVVAALAKETGNTEAIVHATPSYYYDPDLDFKDAVLEDSQRFYIANKMLRLAQPMPSDQILAENLRLAAIKSLQAK
jgi:NitT/TauT family transport system substrate-binding protein